MRKNNSMEPTEEFGVKLDRTPYPTTSKIATSNTEIRIKREMYSKKMFTIIMWLHIYTNEV